MRHVARVPSKRMNPSGAPWLERVVRTKTHRAVLGLGAAVAALAASSVVSAENAPRALSLQQAIKQALERHPSASASRAGREVSRARVGVARAALLPRLDFTESYSRSNGPVYAFGTRLAQDRLAPQDLAFPGLNHPDALDNFRSQLSLSQALFEPTAWLAMRAAEVGGELATAGEERARMGVIFETVRAYHGVQIGAQSLRVAREALASAEADLAQVRALAAGGLATAADVLALQVQHAALREQEIRAKHGLAVMRAELARTLGEPLDPSPMLTTALGETAPPTPAGDLESAALTRSPDAREPALARQLADVEQRRAGWAFAPRVLLGASWESNRRSFLGDGGTNWMVGASLQLNLFNGLGDRARLHEAEALARQARARSELAEAQVRLEVRRARLELESARERVLVAREAVAQAREGHRLVQSQLAQGLARATEVLRAQSARLEAEKRHLAALYEQRLAAVGLELVRGTLTPSSEAIQ